jgi:hypothetical protein
VADKDSEIELLKQMIRSLKTEIKVKLIDISRFEKKVKRLDDANEMRHDFIQTYFKKTFKNKNSNSRVNQSFMDHHNESVTLPPLKKTESKEGLPTKTSSLKKRRKA